MFSDSNSMSVSILRHDQDKDITRFIRAWFAGILKTFGTVKEKTLLISGIFNRILQFVAIVPIGKASSGVLSEHRNSKHGCLRLKTFCFRIASWSFQYIGLVKTVKK